MVPRVWDIDSQHLELDATSEVIQVTHEETGSRRSSHLAGTPHSLMSGLRLETWPGSVLEANQTQSPSSGESGIATITTWSNRYPHGNVGTQMAEPTLREVRGGRATKESPLPEVSH